MSEEENKNSELPNNLEDGSEQKFSEKQQKEIERAKKMAIRSKLYDRINISVGTLDIIIIGIVALIVFFIIFGIIFK